MCLISLACCKVRLYTNEFDINTVNTKTINMKFKRYNYVQKYLLKLSSSLGYKITCCYRIGIVFVFKLTEQVRHMEVRTEQVSQYYPHPLKDFIKHIDEFNFYNVDISLPIHYEGSFLNISLQNPL